MRVMLPASIALATLALCGCPERKHAARDVELKLWHTFNVQETTTLNAIVGRVQQTHPRWRVRSTVIPWAHARNAFVRATTRCEPGAPDLLRAELPWLAEFVDRRLLRPVPASIAEARYLPQARAAVRYRGQRWGLPASLDCLALLYNRALVPEPPATLGALIDVARKLTRDADGHGPADASFRADRVRRWGFYVRADGYWFLPFLWAQGGRLLDPHGGEVYIDSPRSIAALAAYRALITEHRVAPPEPKLSTEYEDQMRRFGNGELAMIVNGPWATAAIRATPAFANPENLGVAPFPRGPDGKPAAPFSGHAYVVSRCSRRPAQAWALARALSSLDAQVQFARANTLLPSLASAYRRPEVASDRLLRAFRRALDAARSRPQHPAMARIFDDFNPAVQAVVFGDATPDEALGAVARAWRRLLAAGGQHR